MLFIVHTGKSHPLSYFSNLCPFPSLSLATDMIFVQQLSLQISFSECQTCLLHQGMQKQTVKIWVAGKPKKFWMLMVNFSFWFGSFFCSYRCTWNFSSIVLHLWNDIFDLAAEVRWSNVLSRSNNIQTRRLYLLKKVIFKNATISLNRGLSLLDVILMASNNLEQTWAFTEWWKVTNLSPVLCLKHRQGQLP